MGTLDVLESLLRVLKIEMYYCSDKNKVETENLIEIARVAEQIKRVAVIALEQKNEKV